MAGELPAAVSEDTFLSDVHVEVKVSPDEVSCTRYINMAMQHGYMHAGTGM